MNIEIKKIVSVFNDLRLYCENKNYKGYDVGDGKNSFFIRKTFLGKIPIVRFVLAQLTGHRVAFLNIRSFLFIKKSHNAKAIALFLNGYCNAYEIIENGYNIGFTKEYCLKKINYLSELLISLGNRNFKGIGWGYPMIWQSRKFSFPANTPTVVATSFAVEALFRSYEITKNEKYKVIALESSDFVIKSLNRTNWKEGFLFSYSPYKGNDGVFNASLLGARILTYCYKYTLNDEFIKLAQIAIKTCVDSQNSDGSWVYGIGKTQKWIDNFHTGYNLEAIQFYRDISKDDSFDSSIDKGFKFFIDNMFDDNGVPKYFHNKQYPIDIHSCGELNVVLHKLNRFNDNSDLADKVFDWTIKNMFDDKKHYFYFQKWKYLTNKAALMRWSQAFMFNSLSYYLKSKYGVK